MRNGGFRNRRILTTEVHGKAQKKEKNGSFLYKMSGWGPAG
jgi:hypothetical protein